MSVFSVFSRIIQSKKAAKEAKEKAAEKEKRVSKIPYKHVPTHAALDALSGAPSSWRIADRPRIKEQNQRRSKMVISRTGSSVSAVSYGVGPSSQVSLPRSSSYNTCNPTWTDRGVEFYPQKPVSEHSKKIRCHVHHDSGIGRSPVASDGHSEEVSPVASSGNSTDSNSNYNSFKSSNSSNSSDYLTIPPPPRDLRRLSQKPQNANVQETKPVERLHTSTTRKLGEAPIHATAPVVIRAPPTMAKANDAPQQKRKRWSLLARRNTVTIIV